MEQDRNALKVQALKERLVQITVEHEDRNADLRVELTIKLDEAQQKIAELESQLAEKEKDAVQEESPEATS